MVLLTVSFRIRALEDGATLGTLLGRINSKAQIPTVTAIYEKIRKARTDTIRDATFKLQEEHHLPDGGLQVARDQHLAKSFEERDVW